MNRICPSCQQGIGPEATTCPHCGRAESNQLVPVCRSVVRPVQRRLPLRLQAAVEIDRTGSSAAFEKGIHLGLEIYLDELSSHVSEVVAWLGSHGDLDFDEQHVTHLESGSPDEALRACRSIAFEGGGDAPEHHLDGIATMLERVPWSADHLTRKTMIAFVNDRTKPARCGVTSQSLGEQIRERGILFYLVCEPDPDLEALVDAADGLLIPISNDPDVDELKRAASAVSRSLTATLTSGGTIPMPPEVTP